MEELELFPVLLSSIVLEVLVFSDVDVAEFESSPKLFEAVLVILLFESRYGLSVSDIVSALAESGLILIKLKTADAILVNNNFLLV